jgi:hypothetical protein
MAIGEKVQNTLWLNPTMLPSLGSVGIQLNTGKYSGNGVPTGIHLLGVVPARLHILGAINFALCICGTCGKGTLHTYPSFRVPTGFDAHPRCLWSVEDCAAIIVLVTECGYGW